MSAAPSLDDAYETFLPDMFAVLGRLRRHGYALPFEDGLDLVHDFLAAHWDQLSDRYDPSRGPFRPYLLRAFQLHARRAARDRARRQASLVDPSVLQEVARAAPLPSPEDRRSARAVAHALAAAPPQVRTVLEVFFASSSERAAARTLGWSRHRFRQALAEAVGQVALAFESPPPTVDPADWDVTVLVLGGGRTPAQTAKLLGIPSSQALAAHRRALRALLAALRG